MCERVDWIAEGSTYGTMFGPDERGMLAAGFIVAKEMKWMDIFIRNLPFHTDRPSRARVGSILAWRGLAKMLEVAVNAKFSRWSAYVSSLYIKARDQEDRFLRTRRDGQMS